MKARQTSYECCQFTMSRFKKQESRAAARKPRDAASVLFR